MTRVTLLCTVRGCGEALAAEAQQLVCPRRHTFDVARSGYVNLLQPQDRRSRTPGDSKEAVAARRRFLGRGFAEPLVAKIANFIHRGPVLDVGCGEGHHLEAFRRRGALEAHGIDISVAAIDLAARTRRACHFIVANADRFLPYATGSFAAVTSITARFNASEFRRVLRPDGNLVIAVAGRDDLIELREAILGERKLIDRTEAAIGALEKEFRLERQESVRTVARLDHQSIEDVMTSSYRAMRTKEREKLAELGEMDVTLSRDVMLFRLRE
ncbi:MAG: methyltransferase domain-containing protein [Thermoanaerobaculia bacterium]